MRNGQVIKSDDYGLCIFAHDDTTGNTVAIDIVTQDGNIRTAGRVEVFEDTVSTVCVCTAREYLKDLRERDAAHAEYHANPAPSLNVHGERE